MSELKPYFDEVQSHYDLSDEFFHLFLDPSLTYSCAYFEREEMSLAEAQLAKIDLSLGKCNLQPGMTLLDIGCGWGAAMVRAVEKYDVNVIGLTLSQNQFDYVNQRLSKLPGSRNAEVRLQGWEEFDEPVDRIVSIGAFEHFRWERYGAFFQRCRDILPPDGRMLLHTIVGYTMQSLDKMGISISHENVMFGKFIQRVIFPGGQLPEPVWVTDAAEKVGFRTEKIQPLQLHYARTLDHWAASLQEREEEAIALSSPEMYERFMHYLTGCAAHFRSGHIDVMQFTLALDGHVNRPR